MKKKIVIVITLVSVAIFVGVLFLSVSYSPNDEISTPPPKAQAEVEVKKTEVNKIEPNQVPFSLYIPAVGINAPIIEVGITKKGNIASPRSFDVVGWYKYGPRPGEFGTAVMDGHVDNGLANPGVFKNLNKIIIGDHIYVQKTNNESIHFIVEEINVLDYNAPTDKIFIDSDTARLVLITCSGDWMPDVRTHDKRFVVIATLYK